jgi:hypothetical protein
LSVAETPSEHQHRRRRPSVAAGSPWMPPVLGRPVVAALVLLGAYLGLSLLMDPMGSLGTDTGGKVATLEVMAANGEATDPDVGYWASPWDPDAELHGLYFTAVVGDRYVNVTTLPMLLAARPLHELGGHRAALLLPMLGAVASAFAGRALARRVLLDAGGPTGPAVSPDRVEQVGWWAYWAVGLASPVAVYALDLWEHTLGVAAMAWAVVALVDARRTGRWVSAAAAGVLFGAGFSMRTESVTYAIAAVGATVVVVARVDRRLRAALAMGAASVAGFAAVAVANTALEAAVLGEPIRAGRAGSAAGRGLGDLGLRAEEALITTFSLHSATDLSVLVLSVGVAAGLAWVAWRSSRPGDRTPVKVVAGVVALLYLMRLAEGPGFVRGLVATTPFAAVGVALAWRRGPTARLVAAIALAALPLVWLFQYTGGALPQWGGRYVLTSGLLLGVLGVACAIDMDVWARRFVAVLAVGITALGLVWLAERSSSVGDAARQVADRPEPVVVSELSFWLRELGAVYEGSRWLTADDPEALARAAEIVVEAGYDRFAYIEPDEDDPPAVEGFRPVGVDETTWLGVPFRIVTYERVDGAAT